jgi:hypothetical protein
VQRQLCAADVRARDDLLQRACDGVNDASLFNMCALRLL